MQTDLPLSHASFPRPSPRSLRVWRASLLCQCWFEWSAWSFSRSLGRENVWCPVGQWHHGIPDQSVVWHRTQYLRRAAIEINPRHEHQPTLWVRCQLVLRSITDQSFPVPSEGHVRRGDSIALVVGDDLHTSILEDTNTWIGSTQINADHRTEICTEQRWAEALREGEREKSNLFLLLQQQKWMNSSPTRWAEQQWMCACFVECTIEFVEKSDETHPYLFEGRAERS